MFEEAAENLELAMQPLGEITFEEMLRFQMENGLVTPKSVAEYNLKNEFEKIREAQKDLPKEEQKSNRKIADELAAKNNCSMSRMYNITRDA